MALDKTLAGIKAIFLDLDGTIYLGDNLIEGSLEFSHGLMMWNQEAFPIK